MELINTYRQELIQACQAAEVASLYVFGSILTPSFNQDSDIDFIVSIQSDNPIDYAENYFELKFALERIFSRKIDLLEAKAIKNQRFERLINEKKKLVYARRNQGVA